MWHEKLSMETLVSVLMSHKDLAGAERQQCLDGALVAFLACSHLLPSEHLIQRLRDWMNETPRGYGLTVRCLIERVCAVVDDEAKP